MTANGALDLLDRLLGHDAWTTRQVLERAQALTPTELDQPFDIGHGSIRETFLHMFGNVEVWTSLMQGETVELDQGVSQASLSIPGLLIRHDRAMTRFSAFARRVFIAGGQNDQWIDTLDKPATEKTYGGAILHIITHDHQHRAEVLHMLARLGHTDLPEGDVLSWERLTFTESGTSR